MNKQLKIIVTGGSGFLGKYLLRALKAAGHAVKNIDLVKNPKFETVIADVRDQRLMNQEIREADAVFHLASLIEAGESVTEPTKYLDYNVSGTLSVLEAMRINNVKTFIFSSSAAIYGEPIKMPIDEDDRTLPINPYGVSKLAMEGLLRSYVANFGFTGVALRYFNLYGPEENHVPETHAIPRFIQQIKKGQEVTIWGNGEHQRDFVYIQDIVEAHLRSLEYAFKYPRQYHYFNLSTGKPVSVIKVIKMIEKLTNKVAKIKHHPFRHGDPLILVANPTKAFKILGWEAQTELKQGLKQTIAYFARN